MYQEYLVWPRAHLTQFAQSLQMSLIMFIHTSCHQETPPYRNMLHASNNSIPSSVPVMFTQRTGGDNDILSQCFNDWYFPGNILEIVE